MQTKNAISSMSQDEVITSRDGELADMVMGSVDDNMEQYGIEVMLFDTKQLDLPDDNKEAVYERMISERDNIAATYKAEGSSEAKGDPQYYGQRGCHSDFRSQEAGGNPGSPG